MIRRAWKDLWLQGLAVVLPEVEEELNPSRIEYAVLAEFAGMIVGATTWGVLADIIGRKVSFNVSTGLVRAGSALIRPMGFRPHSSLVASLELPLRAD